MELVAQIDLSNITQSLNFDKILYRMALNKMNWYVILAKLQFTKSQIASNYASKCSRN